MYFDVNISQRYPKFESKQLEELEYEGICINMLLTPDELDKYEGFVSELCTSKKTYERIEIKINKATRFDVEKALRADLFVINIGNPECFSAAMDMNPDMITFNYTKTSYCFDAQDIKKAIKRNIFFEIPLVGSLYGKGEKMVWMGNVRRLLRATGGRNIVVSSGATCSTETRSPWDFLRILSAFGVDGSAGKSILMNSIRLLRSCSLKRNPMVRQMPR